MSHEIATINGQQMYFGRQAAWHNLGTVTGKYLTWAELVANGLDFQVFKNQLEDGLGRKIGAWGTFRMSREDFNLFKQLMQKWDNPPVPKSVPQIREVMLRSQFLAPVGEDYRVIQHTTGYEIVDMLMQTRYDNGAHYETAGVLKNGAVVWGLADLALDINVKGGDKHKAYLLFTTSHDGSGSYQFKLVDTRVVCWNTTVIALKEKGNAVCVRHTKNAGQKIADVKAALEAVTNTAKSVEEKFNFLVTRRVTAESYESIMNRLFPRKAKDADTGELEESSTRRKNILAQVASRYEYNDGDVFPEHRGTAYNLLNAITEYSDHFRGSQNTTASDRAESALFGSSATLKTLALDVLLAEAETLPAVQERVLIEDLGLTIRN